MKKLLIIITILFFAACKKAAIEPYNDTPGIAFYINGDGTENDSLSYSFANQLEAKDTDTIFLKMRIVGAATDNAREISVKAAIGTTAREGIDYKLPGISLPAGELTVLYPVVLINSEELKDTTFRLVVEVAANKYFEPGAAGREIGNTINMHQYIIDFNNQLIKPGYWNLIQGYFGAYSATKYRFMMQVMGTSDFAPESAGGTLTYADLLNYPVTLRNALAEYEAVHGPLIDENGDRVTF